MVEAVNPQGVATRGGLGRVLLVWHPWQADRPSRGWLEKRRQLVEFRANPRPAKYMFAKAGNFLTQSSPVSVDVFAYGPPLAAVPTELAKPVQVITEPENLKPNSYDTVILMYPDPLGLNWQKVEKTMLRLRASKYLVINGRGRIFVWDSPSRRSLAWRRWLSRAWLIEMLLAPIVWVLSFILALFDGVSDRNREKNP